MAATTALKVHTTDNVGVALVNLDAGSTVMLEGVSVPIVERVAAKHKFALSDLAAGDKIIMYGVLVATATTAIRKGEALSRSNVVHASESFGYRGIEPSWTAPDVTRWRDRQFMGYHREDGQVGTANHWLMIPLVFCENRNVDVLREAFEVELGYSRHGHYRKLVADLARSRGGTSGAASSNSGNNSTKSGDRTDWSDGTAADVSARTFPNVDGIAFLTHNGGCGGTREDARVLCGLIAGYLQNPNVAGATVFSLGCQHAQVSLLKEELARRNPHFAKPLLVFEQQAYPSEPEMLTAAIRETFVELEKANQLERAPAPLSKLVAGVECGGSDGFSGLSANPVIGRVSDLLVALGGSSILSEFPELCGVEQDLIDRCTTRETAERFQSIMRGYQSRAVAVGSGFDMNPSPGNIRDGLITDAIKSAGAARKGGTSPVVDVLDYPEYATRPGLNLLCTPGNDVESTTGLAGAGANLILFSTGLGTPTGNPVAPVIKISTNSGLAERLPDLIDFDTGPVITGERSINDLAEDLLELVIDVASGRTTPNAVRLLQNDFIPWKRGVSL